MRTPHIFFARRGSRRVQWWVSFALFTLLATAWALADPLLAGPDEPEHLRRAYSVASGELIGPARRGVPDHVRFIEVPGPYARADLCFAFHPELSAACQTNFDRGDEELVEIRQATGRYPPMPFAAVGLPSVVWPSAVGVYLMRVLGAALCGALFASALLSLRETRAPWLAASGLAFALTPMVFFLSSVVNPSSLEIAGGVGLWASGVVLVSKARDGVVDGRIVTRTAIAAGVLVLARPLGMLWLGLAGAVLLVTGTWPALRRLLRARVVQIWGGIVGLCVAFELAWITFYDTLGSKVPPGVSAEGFSNFEILRRTFGNTSQSYREMIGVFGWLDTAAPALTTVLWTAALGVLLALGLGLSSRRLAAAIAALLGLIIVVPAILEFIEARRFGFGWQGRYTLPLAVGLPILCGFTLTRKPARLLQRRGLMIVFGIAFVIAHFAAFAQNLRRYTVGINGSLTFWLDADWTPPVPSSFLLIAYAMLIVALAVWLWGGVATQKPEPPETSEVAAVPSLTPRASRA